MADEVTVNLPYGQSARWRLPPHWAWARLMLLDEPTQGMGHEDVDRVTQLIKRSVGRPHHPDGGAQHEGHLHDRRPDHGACSAAPCWPKAITKKSIEQPASDGSLHGHDRRRTAGRTDMAGTPALEIRALRPGTANRMCCMAWTWWCSPARWSRCWGATAPDAPPRCAPSWSLTGARKGSIKVYGTEAIDMATHRIAHLGLGYCPEERGIFSSLSCGRTCCCRPRSRPKAGMSVDEIPANAMFPTWPSART